MTTALEISYIIYDIYLIKSFQLFETTYYLSCSRVRIPNTDFDHDGDSFKTLVVESLS